MSITLKHNRFDLLAPASIILLGIITITLRDFIPYDETRYISVAWEMWRDKNFLIPHISGEIYSDKPPLLFWLVHSGWYLTGVNEWWPRSIPFIFSIINIYLTRYITQRLWPDMEELKQVVPLVLISMPVWLFYTTPFMFDMLQVCLVLVAITGIMQFHERHYYGVLIFGAAAGAGFLLKGPVIFIYILPLALTLPLWDRKYSYGYSKLLLQILAGLLISSLIISCWIVPVIRSLGLDQVRELFWHQTAGRIVHATSHNRPLLWYLYFMPLVLFPWLYRPGFLRTFTVKPGQVSPQIMFCMLWILPPFILLSLFESKQLHYLLPLLPPLAIVIAYRLVTENRENTVNYRIVGLFYIFLAMLFLTMLTLKIHIQLIKWIYEIPPWWLLVTFFSGLMLYTGKIRLENPVALTAIATLATIFAFYVCTLLATRPFTGIDHMAHIIADLQDKNIPVAHIGSHREQFEFNGRLKKPLEKVERDTVKTWARMHPDGYVIARVSESGYPDVQRHIIYKQPYRFRQELILISSEGILVHTAGKNRKSSDARQFRGDGKPVRFNG